MQMDEVTQRNASLVEELAASSEDMKNVASALSSEVGMFKVSKTVSPARRDTDKDYKAPPKKGKTYVPEHHDTSEDVAPAPKEREEVFFDDDKFEEF